jgi:hypothetical protein
VKRSLDSEMEKENIKKIRVASVCPVEKQKSKDAFQVALCRYSSMSTQWHEEIVLAATTQNLYKLAEFLCDHVLCSVRDEDAGGNDVDDHCWQFRIDATTAGVKKTALESSGKLVGQFLPPLHSCRY